MVSLIGVEPWKLFATVAAEAATAKAAAAQAVKTTWENERNGSTDPAAGRMCQLWHIKHSSAVC